MDTFILHVRRLSGLTAATSSTEIIIDGNPKGRISNGGCQDIVLPRSVVNVRLLISVPLGKDIEKTITVDPRDSAEVTLQFTYKFNAKILLPFQAFTKPQSFVEESVIYGPSVVRATNMYGASNTAQQSSDVSSSDRKFCIECGTPNISTAKFCKNCGHKFE